MNFIYLAIYKMPGFSYHFKDKYERSFRISAGLPKNRNTKT